VASRDGGIGMRHAEQPPALNVDTSFEDGQATTARA
jgi:hypothetical protein